VEHGSHEALVARGGQYAAMVDAWQRHAEAHRSEAGGTADPDAAGVTR